MTKAFHELVSTSDARRILTEEIRKVITKENRRVIESMSYISAEDVFSTQDIPPFDRSEVDGFAVNHKSVEEAEEDSPIKLKVIGEVVIGGKPEIEVNRGEAAYISTGSVIPRGADSVVMVERTSRKSSEVLIYKSLKPGENIAHAGADFFENEVLAFRGELINPETVALLSTSGIDRIKVYKKLKIGVFSTGNELIEPGKELEEGMIYDSNSYYFVSSLISSGLASCKMLGILEDDEESTLDFVKKNCQDYDILISSGSTSAGFHDLLYKVVANLKGVMLFHGIAMKPGKPTFLATIGKSIFIGMPGFPLSSASVLRYIVIPSIKRAYGIDEARRKKVKLPFRINSDRGKETVLPAIIGRSGRAYPIFGDSGSISRLSYADGFVIIPSKRSFYGRDHGVEFFPLTERKRGILFIGSNDPLIERIIYSISPHPKIINSGSWGGVEAIRIGEADIAGIHILRGETYNKFIMDGEMKKNSVLVRGFSRSQGFVSREGISSFEKIIENSLIFVNRNKGSGTRDLIEEEIESQMGNNFQRDILRGYFWEAKSHAAVARAVKQGRADVGVSLEFYSKKLNLKFHKIREENYDILMQKELLKSRTGKSFLDRIRNVGKYTAEFPGYTSSEDAGQIIG